MKINKKLSNIFLLFALLFLPTSTVHAQEPNGDVVLFGENYTLQSGDTLNGSIIVFGGNVLIEDDAEVNGDIVLFGGNLDVSGDLDGAVVLFGGNMIVSGSVNGDIGMFGGQAQLTDTSVVDGDISTFGGQVTSDPDAEINGEIFNNTSPFDNPPAVPGVPDVPNVPYDPSFDYVFNPFWEVLSVLFQALLMAGIAALLTLFLDKHIKRVGDFAVAQPLIAGSIGLLSIFVAGLLILTILPIFIIVCAWLLGVVAIGQEVGERFTKAINQTWQPILATAFGTFLLTLIIGYVDLIPCVGWLFNFIVSLIGIGAVMMTRFGTRAGSGPSNTVIEVPAS